MPQWNPDQYLKFADERTRPCRDLAARIGTDPVRRAIDLGCGPGNSTKILAERWPDAEITGLDSSADMIAAARKTMPECNWITEEIGQWAATEDRAFDVVFSNAALQWLPDHAELFPRLLERVTPGGALAVQMPGNYDAPPHELMRTMAASATWRHSFTAGRVKEWHAHDLDYYYDALAPVAARVDIWATEYLHVMAGAEAIVEWYKGTGMRPFLEALDSEAERQRFLAEYLERLRKIYEPRLDGRVLFPFRRIFLIAYKSAD